MSTVNNQKINPEYSKKLSQKTKITKIANNQQLVQLGK